MVNVIAAIESIYPTLPVGITYRHTQPDGSPWIDPVDGLVWEITDIAFPKPTWVQIVAEWDSIKLGKLQTEKHTAALQERDKRFGAIASFVQAAFDMSEVLNMLCNFNDLTEVSPPHSMSVEDKARITTLGVRRTQAIGVQAKADALDVVIDNETDYDTLVALDVTDDIHWV